MAEKHLGAARLGGELADVWHLDALDDADLEQRAINAWYRDCKRTGTIPDQPRRRA